MSAGELIDEDNKAVRTTGSGPAQITEPASGQTVAQAEAGPAGSAPAEVARHWYRCRANGAYTECVRAADPESAAELYRRFNAGQGRSLTTVTVDLCHRPHKGIPAITLLRGASGAEAVILTSDPSLLK